MNKYEVKIWACRSVEVEAENEQEAFSVAFDETEWDFDIKLIGTVDETKGKFVCADCGNWDAKEMGGKCPECGSDNWTKNE